MRQLTNTKQRTWNCLNCRFDIYKALPAFLQKMSFIFFKCVSAPALFVKCIFAAYFNIKIALLSKARLGQHFKYIDI